MRRFVYTFIILGFISGIVLSYFMQPKLYQAFVSFGEYIAKLPEILKDMNKNSETQAVSRTLIFSVGFTTVFFALLGYGIGSLQKKSG